MKNLEDWEATLLQFVNGDIQRALHDDDDRSRYVLVVGAQLHGILRKVTNPAAVEFTVHDIDTVIDPDIQVEYALVDLRDVARKCCKCLNTR